MIIFENLLTQFKSVFINGVFGLSLGEIGFIIVAFILALLIRGLVAKFLVNKIRLIVLKTTTSIDDKFVEIMITETEAYGRKSTDKMALLNTYKNVPTSITLGPPHVAVLKSYGSNRGLFLLCGKKGSAEAVLIRSSLILLGKKHIEKKKKNKNEI